MILEIKNIEKFYDKNHVVKNLNLTIQEGEFLTILGPSGCGKTTTLRMIAGFELPQSGTITLKGNDITKLPPYQRPVNTVFQNYALFPNMTVAENIAFGLQQKNKSKAEIKQKVGEMLEMVRLNGFDNRKPQELSGGQQQRVAIARAVANDPMILLLDEPLGALDLKLRKNMQAELKSFHKELNKTFIYVTHDQEEALTMSDRIAVMNQGVLEQVSDSHNLYYHPQTRFVADFIGEANILNGTISAQNTLQINGQNVPTPNHNLNIGTRASLFVRPENVTINKTNGKLAGLVVDVIFVGIIRKYVILCGTQRITMTETTRNESTYTINEKVYLDWDIAKTSVFEDN